MKFIPTTYTFDASAKTITCADFETIEKISLITNVTTGSIIYQFNNATKLATLSGTTLTLVYDTTAMNDTDDLMIVMEKQDDLQIQNNDYMNQLLAYLSALTIRSNTGRLSVDIANLPTLSAVTTITTLGTLNNQLNIGAYNALSQQQNIANLSWNSNLTL